MLVVESRAVYDTRGTVLIFTILETVILSDTGGTEADLRQSKVSDNVNGIHDEVCLPRKVKFQDVLDAMCRHGNPCMLLDGN